MQSKYVKKIDYFNNIFKNAESELKTHNIYGDGVNTG